MIEIPINCDVKFRIGKTQVLKGRIEGDTGRFVIYTPFNTYIKDEIKAMDGAKWLGVPDDITGVKGPKAWAVKNNERNRFQLAYLLGMNPYAEYDKPLELFQPRRNCVRNHQLDMASHSITRRHCIIAGDMGVGKSLTMIEVLEQSGICSEQILWVGPRGALSAVQYEFRTWQVCQICGKLGKHHKNENHPLVDMIARKPRFVTYEGCIKLVQTWPSGSPAFKAIVFDEASRLKTMAAQRTQACRHLADATRAEHGRNSLIVLLSGTPAPKSPADWYSLAEIACPGYLREGNLQKFTSRLALVQFKDGLGGASYPKLITYFDDENKCRICGKFKDDDTHDNINMCESWFHPFQKSVNEIQKLSQRLQGLVMVKMKKDCLDLPDMIYRRIICKPTPSTLRASQLITNTASSAVKVLTLNRELSDGFIYKEVEKGTESCPTCLGKLIINQNVDLDDPTNPLDSESLTRGHRAIWELDPNSSDAAYILKGFEEKPLRLGVQEIPCTQCKGTGVVPHFEREAQTAPCPKDDALADLLEQYEEDGRFVVWAAFTASVDRCTQLCIKNGWDVIRLDGRGWWSNNPSILALCKDGSKVLEAFDDRVRYPKLAFSGQPDSGGLGLNLTASSVACFYSNTFKGESYWQARDRIHRMGMDYNKGAITYNLLHLPQDAYVLDNLERKRNLLDMSLGQIQEAAKKYEEEFVREI